MHIQTAIEKEMSEKELKMKLVEQFEVLQNFPQNWR